MSRKQILKKAFQKAEKNGYKVNLPTHMEDDPLDKVIEYGIYYKFLFNHDFARAFFIQEFKGGRMVVDPNFHLNCLSEMAREEDPIQYLKKYL